MRFEPGETALYEGVPVRVLEDDGGPVVVVQRRRIVRRVPAFAVRQTEAGRGRRVLVRAVRAMEARYAMLPSLPPGTRVLAHTHDWHAPLKGQWGVVTDCVGEYATVKFGKDVRQIDRRWIVKAHLPQRTEATVRRKGGKGISIWLGSVGIHWSTEDGLQFERDKDTHRWGVLTAHRRPR